jgi:hypothetical protein
LKRNTVFGELKHPVEIVGPMQHLTAEGMLNLTSRNSIVFLNEGQASIVRARQFWKLTQNYGIGEPFRSASEVPMGDVGATQNIRVLSSDPLDRNYLRVDPRSINVPANDPFPGALPPGPAPAEGDWFTRLQDRWRNVQEYLKSRELRSGSTKIRSPEQNHATMITVTGNSTGGVALPKE